MTKNRKDNRDLHGFLVLDKPAGMTSFEATKAVGRALGVSRVGHGGTLDPMATGVLPICVGEATKLAGQLLGGDKTYEAEIVFGSETDTLDACGIETRVRGADGLDEAIVRAAISRFVGRLEQRPPMYSAIRKDGRRLHELAREGIEVERESRSIEVYSFELLTFEPGPRARARVQVRCSKGTYVRVLGADLGDALGSGAHLGALRRLASGPFSIEQAVQPDDVAAEHLLAPVAALEGWPIARLGQVEARSIRDGKRLSADILGLSARVGERVALLTEKGDLLAVCQTSALGELSPVRVFNYGLTREKPSAIL